MEEGRTGEERIHIQINQSQGIMVNEKVEGGATVTQFVDGSGAFDAQRLGALIAAVRGALPADASAEVVESVNDHLATLQEEVARPAPEKGALRRAATCLKAIAEGTAFAASVAALVEFVGKLLAR